MTENRDDPLLAGPVLRRVRAVRRAIHRLIRRLELPGESLAGVDDVGLADGAALYGHPASYYRREALLPRART